MKDDARKFLPLCLLALAAALLACTPPDPAGRPRLSLLAAGDARPFMDVFAAARAEYAKRMGVDVDVTTAPAAALPARLLGPQPPDLVFLCDRALAGDLARRRLVEPEKWLLEQERDQLALVARSDSPLAVAKPEDLRPSAAGLIGLTDADTGTRPPTGAAAMQWLTEKRLKNPLEPRIRKFRNPDDLVRALRAGGVSVAFIRQSQLARYGAGLKTLLRIDPHAGELPPYFALGVVSRSPRQAAAHQLWGYLETNLRGFGYSFTPPAAQGGRIRLPEESL